MNEKKNWNNWIKQNLWMRQKREKNIVEIIIANNKWPIIKLSIPGEMHEIEGCKKIKKSVITRLTSRCSRMCPSKWRGKKQKTRKEPWKNDEIVNFIISILTLPPSHLRLSFKMIGYDLDQIDTTVEKNMLLMSTKITHRRSCLKLVNWIWNRLKKIVESHQTSNPKIRYNQLKRHPR